MEKKKKKKKKNTLLKMDVKKITDEYISENGILDF